MILYFFRRKNLVVKGEITQRATDVLLVHPIILIEVRHYEHDVVDEPLELCLRFFQLLWQEIHSVPLVDSNIVQLHLLVDFA